MSRFRNQDDNREVRVAFLENPGGEPIEVALTKRENRRLWAIFSREKDQGDAGWLLAEMIREALRADGEETVPAKGTPTGRTAFGGASTSRSKSRGVSRPTNGPSVAAVAAE